MENTVETCKIHLSAFIKVGTAVNASASSAGGYNSPASGPSSSAQQSGKHTPITSFSLKELTVSPVYVFGNIPACRAAALQFFGTLIREHVAIYLQSLENPGQPLFRAGIALVSFLASDYGNVEEALNEIDTAMQQDLREQDSQCCLEIFEWSLDALAEISKKYANRRSVAGGCGASGDANLADVLQTYTRCRSTRLLLEILNECVGLLLISSPEQCIAGLLETAARFGSFCDWILTYIGMKYPKTIIEQLLTIGAADFHAYVNELSGKQQASRIKQVIARQEQYQREKLASLSGILGHLAHQQGAELRRQLSAVIQDGLTPDASQRQQYALIFVIKAASLSRDVADLLLQDLHHLVTTDKIAVISRIFGQIPQVIVFGEQNPAHLMISVIMELKESTLSLLYDKLLHLAFDELNLERNDPRTNVYLIQKYALSILEVLMTNMERHVHNNVTFSPESTPLLNEIEKDLPAALKHLFSSNELQRNYYFKCLTLLCFVRGEAKTIEILANVLFRAANEQQLSLFVCFCRILHPVHLKSVQRLFINLPEHYQRHRESIAVSIEGNEENEWLWVENLRTLLCIDQASIESKEVNIMNLTEIFLNHYSETIEYLLPLICVKRCNRTVVDILTKIGQPIYQSPQTVLKLVTCCCSLIFRTLDDVDSPEGLDLHKSFLDYFVTFIHSQPSYAIDIAMRTLLARVMEQDQTDGIKSSSICALFGLSSTVDGTDENGTESSSTDNRGEENKQAQPLTKDDVLRIVTSAETVESFNATTAPLLVGNRIRGLKSNDANGSYTSLDLVHKGVIRRRRDNEGIVGGSTVSEKDLLCKLSFVRIFDRLCSTARPSPPAGGPSSSSSSSTGIGQTSNYSPDVCRILATLITEYFCSDSIAADHSWDDWETTRNSPERLLATSKRVEDIPFSWDLLNIVAEAYPCLWFCAPVIKSIIGTAILQCENAIDKTEKMGSKALKMLDNLFLILYKGRLLTEPLSHVIDLLPHITLHETSCVLGAVWQYFQSVMADSKTLDHHFECIQCNFGGPVEPIKGDHNLHLEVILRVIQANIASAGYLLEKFVDVSESEPMDST